MNVLMPVIKDFVQDHLAKTKPISSNVEINGFAFTIG
jgi:hypothetical protein